MSPWDFTALMLIIVHSVLGCDAISASVKPGPLLRTCGWQVHLEQTVALYNQGMKKADLVAHTPLGTSVVCDVQITFLSDMLQASGPARHTAAQAKARL